ncbi:hypothetical protein T439DRAFT_323289 [Meredithblackwellia eburnea MCA 4105]
MATQDPSQLHFTPNVLQNTQSLSYVKSTTASLSGALAGILGLTNLNGFIFYLITSLSVGVTFALANAGGRSGRYFVGGVREVVGGGVLDNLFGFVLFWTLFYALVHIYG